MPSGPARFQRIFPKNTDCGAGFSCSAAARHRMHTQPDSGASPRGNRPRPLSLKSKLYMLLPKGRFKVVQRHVGGMLDWRVYRRIYEEIRRHPDLDAVEVGAARGAGSIAGALAYKDTAGSGRLVVVEKFEGGSRTADGTYSSNLETALATFDQFGVRDYIRLYPHHLHPKNRDDVLALVKTPRICALIHDADGRIDRDFQIFWPLLIEDGFILVDDYEDVVQKKTNPDGSEVRYTKKALTYRLLNQFAEWGLFAFENVSDGLALGRKPAAADFSRFDPAVCKRIVDEARELGRL